MEAMASTRASWSLAAEEEEALAVAAAVEALHFLGDRNRLRILKILARGELSVGEIVAQLALPQPLVSYHLRRLRQSGIVQVRRQGKQVHYAIDPPAWEAFTRPIREVCDVVTIPSGSMAESTNAAST
jgi:DNA-binding transcriptional ArsR family regulator